MTAVAIALLSFVLPGKDQGRRMAAGLPVYAAVLLASCDDKPAKEKAKPDRSALAAGGAAFVVRVDPAEGGKVAEEDLVRAGAVLEKRLNPKGTRDVIVTSMADNKLMVEVAGLTVAEAEAARPLLHRPARLEFRLLGPGGIEETTKGDAAIKPGYVKLRYLDDDKADPGTVKAEKYIWVKNKAELSGNSVEEGEPMISPGARNYEILVKLHDKHGDKMLAITRANLGKPMAIIVDGEVISAPTINGVFGSNFQITGSFTEAEAVELSSQLMNPLENPLHVEKISAIPPTAAGKK